MVLLTVLSVGKQLQEDWLPVGILRGISAVATPPPHLAEAAGAKGRKTVTDNFP